MKVLGSLFGTWASHPQVLQVCFVLEQRIYFSGLWVLGSSPICPLHPFPSPFFCGIGYWSPGLPCVRQLLCHWTKSPALILKFLVFSCNFLMYFFLTIVSQLFKFKFYLFPYQFLRFLFIVSFINCFFSPFLLNFVSWQTPKPNSCLIVKSEAPKQLDLWVGPHDVRLLQRCTGYG